MTDYLLSMTGYGEATVTVADKEWHFVVQSVNSRYLDCRCRLPHALQSLEPQLRSVVKKYVERGKVDVVLNSNIIESDDPAINDSASVFNNKWISSYCLEGSKMIDSLGWTESDLLRSTLFQSALSRREAYEAPADDLEDLSGILNELLVEALKVHLDSRKNEGLCLAADFRFRVAEISQKLILVEKLAAGMPDIFKERIAQRLNLMLADAQLKLDETRLYQEVAYLIDKADISEEIVRLRAHLEQFIQELEISTNNRKGKKLEFVVQEMLREINTIGSKANLLEITRNVVDMKNELEKIREQVQNVI